MDQLRILSEDHYTAGAESGAPGVTLVRTAHFTPKQDLDTKALPADPQTVAEADSYVVLTPLLRPGAPPFAGFLTWYPAPLYATRWPHLQTDAAGKPQWRLAYGFLPLDGAQDDSTLLALLQPIWEPVHDRVPAALRPVLAQRLQADLWTARTFFQGDLAQAQAKSYADHLRATVAVS